MRTDPAIFDDLRAIQDRDGYLSNEALDTLARSTKLPLFYIHGLASCYPHFRREPPARAEVKVCMDMTCHLRGACVPIFLPSAARIVAV